MIDNTPWHSVRLDDEEMRDVLMRREKDLLLLLQHIHTMKTIVQNSNLQGCT